WSRAVNETTRLCLMADPAWNGQEFTSPPTRGWQAWLNVQRVLVSRTPHALAEQFPNPADLHGWTETLRRQWLVDGFDAHDFIYQSRAYDMHDVGATPGFHGVASALASIVAQALILTPPLDLYNPVEDARLAAASIRGATHREIPSKQGHQSASGTTPDDVAFLNRVIGAFLDSGR